MTTSIKIVGLWMSIMVCIMLALSSCKKEDYRTNYIGDWDFVVEREWSIGWDKGHDTIYYSGKISLVDSDSLNIEYMENAKIIIHIDEQGKLFNYYYMYYHAHGQFVGYDKIYLETGYSRRIGREKNIIIGIKKKGSKNE